jgi:hypothetical protein
MRSWYSASKPVEMPAEPVVTSQRPLKKRKKNKQLASTEPAVLNPYTPLSTYSSVESHPNRFYVKSPAYAPPSPVPAAASDYGSYGEDWDEEEEDDYDYPEEWYDQSYALSAPEAGPSRYPESAHVQSARDAPTQRSNTNGISGVGPPAFASRPAAPVSAMEAMNNAMTAQYWAGFWMGVTQAKSAETAPSQQIVRRPAPGSTAQADAEFAEGTRADRRGGPSNLFVTKQRFSRPSATSFTR